MEPCVASVWADRGEHDLELVVVDNNSGDGSVERLRAALPDATILASPCDRGFAADVNDGFRQSTADTVIVLPHLISSVIRYLQMQGVPRMVSRLVIGGSLTSSWLTLRAIALLPAKRERVSFQARSYKALLRELW